jgi:HMG-box domain
VLVAGTMPANTFHKARAYTNKMSQSSRYCFDSAEAETPKADMANASAKPKRPLSAYNFFFKMERAKILQEIPDVAKERKPRRSHGKIGFKELATRISSKWKSLSMEERAPFDEMAAANKESYLKAKIEWYESVKKSSSGAVMQQATLGRCDELAGCQPNTGVESVDLNQIDLPRLLLFTSLQEDINPEESEQQNGPVETQESQACLFCSSVYLSSTMCCSCRLPLDRHFSDSFEMMPLQSPLRRDLDRQLFLDLDDECKEFLKKMFK